MAPVAVVTGSAMGIGRQVARTLAGEGYDLVLVDVQDQTELLGELRDRGCAATAVVCDVASEDDVERLAARVEDVDVLVNNAGISLLEAAETTTAQQWRRVLDVNLTGPFLLCRRFGRRMLEKGAGSIVNIASIAGLHAVADRSAYNASKHGLIGLTKTLAAEWGGRGVRVNAVCPGWVKTEMDAADQASGGYTDQDVTDRVPMGRFATPEDIAAAVAFLADPARSGFINGAQLPVDGGWIADASWTSLRLRKR
ncbi:SDR family NAD(P)-dependent oxidoreductase [Labedaea rhizosphaerae]|uniref:NAD(P)-dependent dehydrogenase (Short-subunit alcohol dehydrogenase family) n=1 Tax=Labedaea rhizosphaerae TaxID=598644 RepID=A0A4R6SD09_LABRH|nr:SDR family oxidoreductase [Labedaea rhizosphaerae]TDP97969.1 NAD(P)-dependent dehydrogenase (short-subunit alcohol dehydrogenase family) [Labedaea rhizosphaerae]